MFPARTAGLALLILRLCVAGTVVLLIPNFAPHLPLPARVVPLVVAALFLCAGAFTPVICAITAIIQLCTFPNLEMAAWPDAILHVAFTACLLFLGPGAYSVDGKRFGRQLIASSGH